jgi:hypothetical protein
MNADALLRNLVHLPDGHILDLVDFLDGCPFVKTSHNGFRTGIYRPNILDFVVVEMGLAFFLGEAIGVFGFLLFPCVHYDCRGF